MNRKETRVVTMVTKMNIEGNRERGRPGKKMVGYD
jgi:hypothetical protein